MDPIGAQASGYTLKILRKAVVSHQPGYTNGDRRSLQGGSANPRSAATEGPSGRDNPQISGYVDIHAHILPGIDDGPPDLEQSLEMARAAVDSGISMIAATPHLRSDFPGVRAEEIADRCKFLRDALDSERIPLDIVPAAEVSLTWALDATDDQLRLASYGQHGKDLLIETPFTPTAGLDRFLYLLRTKGYRVTLAHPERNRNFQANDAPLRALAEQGILLQLNADSLIGHIRGSRTKRLAKTLLLDGLIHVIASDGHRGSSWRPVTRLSEAVDAAAELVGASRAKWMAETAPGQITGGGPMPAAPPVTVSPRRRRLFGRR